MRAEDVRGGCCGTPDAAQRFEDRVSTGMRRRVLVRRAALAAAGVLCLASVLLSLLDAGAVVGGRLAWAAVVCAAGLGLGWVRQAWATHRPGWRLLVALVALAAGVGWSPVVPAVVAVAALAEHTLRPAPKPAVRPAVAGVTAQVAG